MPDLRQFLDRLFQESGGALPFEAFMSAALYDPEFGYYTRGIAEVGGGRGDFATAATLSDGLGQAVASWIREEAALHRWRGQVPVIEVGGGNGALAAAILKSLGWVGRRRFRYHLVEISPTLRELQRRRLGRSATWHGTLGEALEATGGRALILSNELIDAFPVVWLRRDAAAGGWREICLARDEAGGLRELFREARSELDPAAFSALALPDPPEGQRIEVSPLCRRWFAEWAPRWEAGSILTIDYGARDAGSLYRRRPGGTLRAYHRHERLEGGAIYARFGRQDLTCDVNFGDLLAWGEALGFETVGLETQAEFLARRGAAADPMAGSGPGDAFLALRQRRGIPFAKPAPAI
jgi:SAM-dependent MidA family methyltransferase